MKKKNLIFSLVVLFTLSSCKSVGTAMLVGGAVMMGGGKSKTIDAGKQIKDSYIDSHLRKGLSLADPCAKSLMAKYDDIIKDISTKKGKEGKINTMNLDRHFWYYFSSQSRYTDEELVQCKKEGKIIGGLGEGVDPKLN